MKIAVCSGSFDPFHNGHAWMVEQCQRLFDETHVLIGHHPGKVPMFDPQERMEMVQYSGLCGPNLLHINATNDVGEYFREIAKRHTLYRIRTARFSEEAKDEWSLAWYTKVFSQCPMIQMIMVVPEPLNQLSSTLVKEFAKMGDWDSLAKIAPEHTCKMMKAYFHNPLAGVLGGDQTSLGN